MAAILLTSHSTFHPSLQPELHLQLWVVSRAGRFFFVLNALLRMWRIPSNVAKNPQCLPPITSRVGVYIQVILYATHV